MTTLRPEDGATLHGGIEKRGQFYVAWCRAQLEQGGKWSAETKEWAYNFRSEREAVAWIDLQCLGRGFDRWQVETAK